MTAAAPYVLSAISGGSSRPWHYASSVDEQRKVVDRLLGETEGHVLFYVWDRPAGRASDDYPGQQLKIVYRNRYGAAHFTNSDPAHGPVGAWLAHLDRPHLDAPKPIYDPWDPERVTIPDDAVLSIDQLRTIVAEYARTGRQPANLMWTAVDFV